MLPLLVPGSEVLTQTVTGFPKEGEIWVLRHPTKPQLKIIKLVTRVSAQEIVVAGLNSAKSEDSRSFGAVSPTLFLGKVESRFL
ncbi:MAG TPA: S26 family signal peptidase [Phycisphaerales bacterium]|nr:S26 family signal peptidase [Phycisphaerales bacterium]